MGSNLLYKASIVTTPTAYGVGVLNSIKPAILFGEELVTNGDFSNGTTSWNPNTNATLSIEDGRLKVAISGAGSGYPLQNITTEVGKKYIITANAYIGTATKVSLYSPPIGFNDLTADGSYNLTFTATSTSTQLRLYVYGDGSYGFWDNVSVKKVTDADFDFTRNSSATRVNPDYLIQDVSILSSNLVQNGNFSELGSELVTNGNFETDTNWTKSSQSTIINGKARILSTDGSFQFISQTGYTASQNKTVKITLDIVEYVSGTLKAQFTGGSNYSFPQSVGTHTLYVVNDGSAGTFNLARVSGVTDITIDNVSVKQVDPNDNWTLGTGWSIGNNKANSDGSQSSLSNLYQTGIVPINKTYKATFTIVVTSGSIVLSIGGSNAQPTVSSSGTYSFTSKATSGDSNLYFSASSDFVGSVTNISAIEVQKTDIPRLDYTNGTASILLEPQSTNLWTESEGTSITLNSPLGEFGFYTLKNNQIDRNIPTSDPISFTFIVKKIDGTTPTITFSGGNGDLVIYVGGGSSAGPSGVLTNIGDGFYKYELTGQSNAGTGIEVIQNKSGVDTYVSLIQFEVGTYATSYIPTSGSTVTRAAETLNNAGNSDLINSTEGVLYAEIAALSDDLTFRTITLSDGTTSNNVGFGYRNNSNVIYTFLQGVINSSSAVTVSNITDFNKVAIKYKSGDYAMWINGVKVYTNATTFTLNGLSEVSFDNGSGAADFYGRCKTVAVFKEALSDTELACLTSTNNREIFLNYYYRMQYVGANTEALSCAEQTFNI